MEHLDSDGDTDIETHHNDVTVSLHTIQSRIQKITETYIRQGNLLHLIDISPDHPNVNKLVWRRYDDIGASIAGINTRLSSDPYKNDDTDVSSALSEIEKNVQEIERFIRTFDIPE